MALGDDLNLGLVSLVKQGMLDNAPKNLGGIYGTDLTEAERAANIQDISKAEGTPLYGIPEFDRLQYAARNYRSMPSLYEMYLSGGSNVLRFYTGDTISFVYDGSKWYETNRSDNT